MQDRIVTLPYRKGTVDAVLPQEADVLIVEPNEVKSTDDCGAIISKAIRNPVGSERLESFLASNQGNKLLVIVNDQTRPTPTKNVLDEIIDMLDLENTTFIVATGVHRGPTEEEYGSIFGKHFPRIRHRIVVHDARDDEQMVYLGKSSSGTEMYVNRLAVDSDRILVIGSVEPHYFAGYTGGRKGLLPGISAFATIEQNHKNALSPEARSLKLEGNPVHQDMADALSVIKTPIFAIMTVLDKSHGVYAATSGDIHESFNTAIRYADEVFVVEIPHKADIVISAAKHPMDIDLYQSQKAIDNGKLAMKKGGILILLSSCRDGIGEPEFYKLLSSCATPSEVLNRIKGNYRLGWHKAGKMAEVNLQGAVWGVTELKDEVMNGIFIKPFASIQNAVDAALEIKGREASIAILPDGCVTVPRADNGGKVHE